MSAQYPRLALATFIGLAILLSACRAASDDREGQAPAPLLLISIDGFRHDYIEQFDSPAIDRLIEEGLYADSLHHAFQDLRHPLHTGHRPPPRHARRGRQQYVGPAPRVSFLAR